MVYVALTMSVIFGVIPQLVPSSNSTLSQDVFVGSEMFEIVKQPQPAVSTAPVSTKS